MSPFGIKEAKDHQISMQTETEGLEGVDLHVHFFCVIRIRVIVVALKM